MQNLSFQVAGKVRSSTLFSQNLDGGCLNQKMRKSWLLGAQTKECVCAIVGMALEMEMKEVLDSKTLLT